VSQTPEERFREYLASRPTPQRFTDQQRELVGHIFAKHKHFDADELIDDLKRADRRVSRATVYRTLGKLVEAGLLRTIEIGSRTVYDHDYGYPQHDHLVCDGCGAMIEFQHPALDAVIREAAAGQGFRPVGHSLVVHGTCGACNAARAARHRLVM
jgi:Fur family ferric uptake transcriptional regulator